MAVQRTVLCPHCDTPRTTKAAGRQLIGCPSCGHTYAARDAKPLADAVGAAAGAPLASSGRPGPAGTVGGVRVLPAANLKIAGLAFPEPSPKDPAGPAPSRGEPHAPTPDPAPVGAPVSTAPARRRGYYGRVTGGRH